MRARLPIAIVILAALSSGSAAARQTSGAPYTILAADARRSVAVRVSNGVEYVTLDALAPLFGLRFVEDPAAGGLVIETRGQRIIAVPGQSFAQVAGQLVSLAGPIQRERAGWMAPVDFLTKALGPAIKERIVVRRASRLIVVGAVVVPTVSARLERSPAGGRVDVEVDPPVPYRVSRDQDRLIVRFDAVAIDAGAVLGSAQEFATAARFDGVTFVIDLGDATAEFRASAERDGLSIDLLPAPPPAAPPPVRPPPAAAPPAETPADASPNGLRAIVLDPGHGGADAGARGPGGLVEKDLTLQVARRLQAALEGRLGVRVTLTREGDEDVALDRRTATANNVKADVFVSLHANRSPSPDARGAQVLSLAADAYVAPGTRADRRRQLVPFLNGPARLVEALPWDLAQVPLADRSAALAAVVVERLAERAVPLHARPAARLPLRVLTGAGMPAVLVELGFLSNAADEQAIGGDLQPALVDALATAIADLPRATSPRGPGG